MTTDPYKHHAELSCPCCHVKGKVITNSADGVEFDQGCFTDEPFVCCECGSSWLDSGTFVDDALKEYRVNLMRLVEGRPYEPPKPKPSEPSKLDLSAFDKMLADAWRKDIEERAKRPPLDLSKLTKAGALDVLLTSNVSAERRGHLLASTWAMRSNTLPTGDTVTSMGGGNATVSCRTSDVPWIAHMYDVDGDGRQSDSLLLTYPGSGRRYVWNLATDEVTEK